MYLIFYKKIRFIFISIFCLILFLNCVNLAIAANLSDAFSGDDSFLDKAAIWAGYDTDNPEVEIVIARVIQAALSFVGVVFLILAIYGGYLWMTARGNEDQVTKAKNTIRAAAIGLIIVLAAFAISVFVVQIFGEGTLSDEAGG